MSVAPDLINKSLTSDTISNNMFLQGELVAKEAKGFLINFGLKDKTQGFLPFDASTEHLSLGALVHVVVKTIMSGSKIIKCELASKDSSPANNKELTIHNIKPGFLVAAKVSKLFDNGIELSFLGGFNGTVFVDHLDRSDPKKYKVGEKLNARLVSVDQSTQILTLSLLPHLVSLQNQKQVLEDSEITVGKVFENVLVSQVAFGDSYKLELPHKIMGFLHKTHAVAKEKETRKSRKQREEREAEEEEAEEEEVKQVQYNKIELEKGKKVEKVRVKEINYFDGVPILSMRDDILGSAALTYD